MDGSSPYGKGTGEDGYAAEGEAKGKGKGKKGKEGKGKDKKGKKGKKGHAGEDGEDFTHDFELVKAAPTVPYTEHTYTYGEVNGEPLQMKVHRPENSGSAPPCIIYFAGSGFSGTGMRLNGKKMAFFVDRGYAMVACPYRGHRGENSGQTHFPTPLFEALAALRYLRTNAETIGIDPKRIISMGGSSGGWYAVMLALCGTKKFRDAGLLGGDGLDTDPVCCAVDYFGPQDFELFEAEWEKHRGTGPTTDKGYFKFLGISAWPDDLTQVKRASTLSYIGPDTPPIFVTHGAKDAGVPISQSEALVGKLKEQSVQHEYHPHPEAEHGGYQFTEPDWLEKVAQFLKKHVPAEK